MQRWHAQAQLANRRKVVGRHRYGVSPNLGGIRYRKNYGSLRDFDWPFWPDRGTE
jgi:hypothetical protein